MRKCDPYILLIFLSSPFLVNAQSAYQEIREGNEAYKNNDYVKAEELFRESIQKNPEPMESAYNLGNALYRQGKFEDAARYFNMAAAKTEDKQAKSRAFHNLGNALLKSKKLEESIQAYKNALINNPEDEESRYNLAYAKQMLQKQQEQQKENKQDQQEKEEEEQENQENQEEEKKESQEEQQQKEEQKEEKQQQEQQQKEQQVSREDAERLLEALNEKEKDVQEKLKKKKVKDVDVDIEKDW